MDGIKVGPHNHTDFDWQGMADFVADCEDQRTAVEVEHALASSPLPEEDQTQWSFYGSPYAAVAISQPCVTDGSTFFAHSALETCTTDSSDSVSSTSSQQPVYAALQCVTYENRATNCVPFYAIDHHYVQPDSYLSSAQQIVPQEVVPESTAVSFPIKIEVLGYVSHDDIKQTTPSSKKRRAKRPRKLKKFTSAWNCEPCARSFKSQGGLVQHNQQIHSGPTPHQCDICGKRYRDFDTMQQHRQRHLMKDKPCKCDECPKQFIRQSDLQRHVNLHHRVSRHSCGLCGKAFDRADHLKDHEWSHANGTARKMKAEQGNDLLTTG